jgi:hypothetical protein
MFIGGALALGGVSSNLPRRGIIGDRCASGQQQATHVILRSSD